MRPFNAATVTAILALAFAFGPGAQAQSYPDRPSRIVVPYPAGGGKTRLSLLPDVPTFAESGYPDIPSNAWFGLFVPTGTPRDIVMKLHGEIARMLKETEFNQKEVVAKGYEFVASTPEEFAAFLAADSARNARAVKISGAKAE